VDAAAVACGIRGSATEAALVSRTVELSSRAGVPAGELLRAEAEEQRRQARADAASRAASLSVRLMLPLGVCVLPAFMLLGVAPLLISVIASTVAGF
jgi:tight adherence protein B